VAAAAATCNRWRASTCEHSIEQKHQRNKAVAHAADHPSFPSHSQVHRYRLWPVPSVTICLRPPQFGSSSDTSNLHCGHSSWPACSARRPMAGARCCSRWCSCAPTSTTLGDSTIFRGGERQTGRRGVQTTERNYSCNLGLICPCPERAKCSIFRSASTCLLAFQCANQPYDHSATPSKEAIQRFSPEDNMAACLPVWLAPPVSLKDVVWCRASAYLQTRVGFAPAPCLMQPACIVNTATPMWCLITLRLTFMFTFTRARSQRRNLISSHRKPLQSLLRESAGTIGVL
jgi:hypothetical protein